MVPAVTVPMLMSVPLVACNALSIVRSGYQSGPGRCRTSIVHLARSLVDAPRAGYHRRRTCPVLSPVGEERRVLQPQRIGQCTRETGETRVIVSWNLDGGGASRVATGVGF